MKKLIWTIIFAFGLAMLPFGGTALAGQGHKAAAHAGKHHGKKHHANHAGRHFKNK
jgi:hypothetical protein